MKSFVKESNNNVSAVLMDVVPLIMNHLRAETRRQLSLSMPQLRTLLFLYHHENTSLSEVADYVGLKLPSMSKTVNSLVVRKLVTRGSSPRDRRCIRLKLSSSGLGELMRTRQHIEARLSETLVALTPEQQAEIAVALQSLRPLFVRGEGGGKK